MKSDEAAAEKSNEAAHVAEIASDKTEPTEPVEHTVLASQMAVATQYQSLKPPTEDIDFGWGEEDEQPSQTSRITVQPTKIEGTRLTRGSTSRCRICGSS